MEMTQRPTENALASTVAALARCNEKTGRFGLRLQPEEMTQLARQRFEVLEQTGRVEFGDGVLEQLIEIFQDSPYLHQGAYAETIGALQALFYHFKNESQDRLTDEILLREMKRIFDGPAGGSLEYLSGAGLEDLCRWVRTPEMPVRSREREEGEEAENAE